MKRYKIYLMLILLLFPLIFGCASIKVENMVTNHSPSDSPNYPVNVSVDVTGGSSNMWSGTITPEEFKKAVLISLEKTAFFNKIIDQDNTDYVLSISLKSASSHPGFTMHAWVKAEWTLHRKKDNETVWTAEVEGDGNATVGDAFIGMTRECMALERAAKSNIDQALSQMSDLSL